MANYFESFVIKPFLLCIFLCFVIFDYLSHLLIYWFLILDSSFVGWMFSEIKPNVQVIKLLTYMFLQCFTILIFIYFWFYLLMTRYMCVCILHVCGRGCSMMCVSEGMLWITFSPSIMWTPEFNSSMRYDTQVSLSFPFLKYTLKFLLFYF